MGLACNEAELKLEKYTFDFSSQKMLVKICIAVNSKPHPVGWNWQCPSVNQFCAEGVTM